MRRAAPLPRRSFILGGGLRLSAFWLGLSIAAVVIPMQATARAAAWEWPTMTLTVLARWQLGHALAARSEHRSLWRLGPLSNHWPALSPVLFVAVELGKLRRRERRRAAPRVPRRPGLAGCEQRHPDSPTPT